ncbi:MAG: hypothetical protein PF569_01780 [Candidatus Woesearchaeota archaeon]|jgi:hypothetical protein|nr:hypothetical protein [Candidatus Woesearchaeota archaeon]
MVDNFNQISELLQFSSEDDFYFLQILQRKKDNPTGYLGSNNSSRLIKAYYIKSKEELLKRKEEVVKLCEVFNARAGINLNKRSYYKTSFNVLKNIAELMHNKAFTKVHRAWNTACGVHNGGDRIWLLDFDYIPTNPDWYIDIKGYLYGQHPMITNKVLAFIPSKNGVHVITKPFDPRQFAVEYPDVEIHKNNPTSLYIP